MGKPRGPGISGDYLNGRLWLMLDSPLDGSTVYNSTVWVKGTTIPGAELTINGYRVAVDADGSFWVFCSIPLQEGRNNITAVVNTPYDNGSVVLSVTYEVPEQDGGDH